MSTPQYQSAASLDDDLPNVDYFRSGDGIPSRTVLVDADLVQGEQFDEDLDVREDPHLWSRLLETANAERIDEATAVKRRRSDSLTGDAETMYQAEQAEIDKLVARDDEYEAVEEERRARCEYRHGRRLLRRGDHARARRHLWSAYRRGLADTRLYALLAVSVLPTGHDRALSTLERLQEVVG